MIDKPVQAGYYEKTLREFAGVANSRVAGSDGLPPLRRIEYPDGFRGVMSHVYGRITIETGPTYGPALIVIRQLDENGNRTPDDPEYAIDVGDLLATPFFKRLIENAQRQVVDAAENGVGRSWRP